MTIEFGLTDELVNTQYAPLAALSVHYRQNLVLKPLENVQIPLKTRDFSPSDKLIQVLMSILAGCETLFEVNIRLKPKVGLAQVWQWDRFTDQSNLSRTLDALTLKQIDQVRDATTFIGFILLTDLAHNSLADFYHRALIGTRFEGYGLKRIVRDLLATPGRLVFEGNELKRIELPSLKQFASDLLICLEKYCLGD
jgi:hypothetical protein